MTQYAAQTGYREEEVRTVANPTPLGLLSLALTTALLGASFAHFLVPTVSTGIGIVIGPAIFYGGIVQILAGMWEYRRQNTLAATLFSAYGGFLLAFGALFLPSFGLRIFFGLDILAFNHALGLLFLCWTISCAVLLLGSIKSTMLMQATLVCLTLSFLFLTIGEFANANTPLLMVGGWLAILCALVAWYAALVRLMQATHSPFHLPAEGRAPFTPEQHYGHEPAV